MQIEDVYELGEDAYSLGTLIGHLSKQQHAYQWRVLYQDGTATDEYDGARKDGRGFAEREEKPVAELVLMTWEPFDDQEYRMPIPDDAEPIFFRRHTLSVNLSVEAPTHERTVHCIGWKRGDEAMYLFVRDDGSTLLTSDLQAV